MTALPLKYIQYMIISHHYYHSGSSHQHLFPRYCNSFPIGLSASALVPTRCSHSSLCSPLIKVAKVIILYTGITPILQTLQQFPISVRVKAKIINMPIRPSLIYRPFLQLPFFSPLFCLLYFSHASLFTVTGEAII